MVVLLMLIPLLAPSESGAPAGLATVAKALGVAAIKVWIHFTTLWHCLLDLNALALMLLVGSYASLHRCEYL